MLVLSNLSFSIVTTSASVYPFVGSVLSLISL